MVNDEEQKTLGECVTKTEPNFFSGIYTHWASRASWKSKTPSSRLNVSGSQWPEYVLWYDSSNRVCVCVFLFFEQSKWNWRSNVRKSKCAFKNVHLLRCHWSLSWLLLFCFRFSPIVDMRFTFFLPLPKFMSIWLILRMCFVFILFSFLRSFCLSVVFFLFCFFYYGYWFVYIFVLAPRFIRIALHPTECHDDDLDTHQINCCNKQQFLQLIIGINVTNAHALPRHYNWVKEPPIFGCKSDCSVKKSKSKRERTKWMHRSCCVVCLRERCVGGWCLSGARVRSFIPISFRSIWSVKYALDCTHVTCYH